VDHSHPNPGDERRAGRCLPHQVLRLLSRRLGFARARPRTGTKFRPPSLNPKWYEVFLLLLLTLVRSFPTPSLNPKPELGTESSSLEDGQRVSEVVRPSPPPPLSRRRRRGFARARPRTGPQTIPDPSRPFSTRVGHCVPMPTNADPCRPMRCQHWSGDLEPLFL